MVGDFDQIERAALESGRRLRIALACAQDRDALEAVVTARRRGVAEGILIGDAAQVEELLASFGEDTADYRIVSLEGEAACAAHAVELVRAGQADAPMKGLLHTAAFMRAILNRETGLRVPGQMLSQCQVVEVPGREEPTSLYVVSDVAVAIAPGVEEKAAIARNAARLARELGCEDPKVAMLSALETVNDAMPSSVEAAEVAALLADELTIQGPLAFDIAVSAQAAEHKGVSGPVAGAADVLVVPTIEAGNILTKALLFFAGFRSAGVLMGLSHPVIMTSRTDTAEDKYLSILLALLRSAR